MRNAMTKRIITLPAQLRRTLTWDQGPGMSEHVRFTVDTGVQVYFCDREVRGNAAPTRTPTGSSANTCRRAPISRCTTSASSTPSLVPLNRRPRKTLGFMSPSEAFAEAVASTD